MEPHHFPSSWLVLDGDAPRTQPSSPCSQREFSQNSHLKLSGTAVTSIFKSSTYTRSPSSPAPDHLTRQRHLPFQHLECPAVGQMPTPPLVRAFAHADLLLEMSQPPSWSNSPIKTQHDQCFCWRPFFDLFLLSSFGCSFITSRVLSPLTVTLSNCQWLACVLPQQTGRSWRGSAFHSSNLSRNNYCE